MLNWLSQNWVDIAITMVLMVAISQWSDWLYKKRLVEKAQDLKTHADCSPVEFILGEPYVIVEEHDYYRLIRKFNESERIKKHLISLCHQTCAGRENYIGKLRHVPDCPAYNLGLLK